MALVSIDTGGAFGTSFQLPGWWFNSSRFPRKITTNRNITKSPKFGSPKSRFRRNRFGKMQNIEIRWRWGLEISWNMLKLFAVDDSVDLVSIKYSHQVGYFCWSYFSKWGFKGYERMQNLVFRTLRFIVELELYLGWWKFTMYNRVCPSFSCRCQKDLAKTRFVRFGVSRTN